MMTDWASDEDMPESSDVEVGDEATMGPIEEPGAWLLDLPVKTPLEELQQQLIQLGPYHLGRNHIPELILNYAHKLTGNDQTQFIELVLKSQVSSSTLAPLTGLIQQYVREDINRIECVLSSKAGAHLLLQLKDEIKRYVENANSDQKPARLKQVLLSNMGPMAIKPLEDSIVDYIQNAPEVTEKHTRLEYLLRSHCHKGFICTPAIKFELLNYLGEPESAGFKMRANNILKSPCCSRVCEQI